MNHIYKETKFEDFVWIDILNPSKENLDDIAKDYDLDVFQIRDSLEIAHLPKIEKLNKYTFMILRAFTGIHGNRITNINELSNKVAFFYDDKKVITIHKARFDFLENVVVQLKSSEELVVFFIHKMIQTFEQPAEVLGDKTDEMEKTIFLKNYSNISLEDLYYQKAQTRITKKLLQITQTVVLQLDVSDKSRTSLQDIKDRLVRLILVYDEVLENSYNLLNTYLSVSSQKSNEVMKLLTIFSAFFLPLTFIVGVYGMNFVHMPELKWHYGYYISLAVMAGISLVIYLWFKRKKIL